MLTRMVILLAASALAVMALGAAPGSAPATTSANGLGPDGKPVPRIKLWDKTPGIVEGGGGRDADADPREPRMDVFLPTPGKGNGAAVIILPGGGYTNLAMPKEGGDVARMFVGHDVAAFVVMYRHASRYHYPTPLLDAQRAIRLIRSKAADYAIDPKRIGILGFSAGGHLAAMTTTLFADGPKPESPDAIDALSARPDFAILMYPVINMTDDAVTHKGSRTSLTQNNKELFAALSPEQHVTKDTPPIFLVHGTNDRTVPVMNSVLMYEACLKAGVPAEIHIFENGPHGFGLGGTDPVLKTWPDLAIAWMNHNKWLDK